MPKAVTIQTTRGLYRAARPLLFLTNSEKIHEQLITLGELFGKSRAVRSLLRAAWRIKDPALRQTVCGIDFQNPVGLAAGFDYEARLTNILPAIGFGFETVGTITNHAYEGNPTPRLGRLIKSRSLLVNKGFKNEGIRVILDRLSHASFSVPVGISIGKTNSREPMTQEQAVDDVVAAFKAVEAEKVPFSYYELNISCPNLYGNVEFYSPEHLRPLVAAVTGLKLSRPLFVKMPISKTDEETAAMLDVLMDFPVNGVAFGNLQTNRNDPSILPHEAAKYSKGYFSGKPTEKRSNELIRLAYKRCGAKLVVIGCGGIMSAEDAYKKIKLGATLVQLITGLIYVGPQLPGQVNAGLIKLLKRDGFKNISEAIGKNA